MVRVLILTHGRMADELLSAGRTIMGNLEGFEALTLDWSDGLDAAESKVAEAVAALDQGSGVLILTDIYGGTPSNVALKLVAPGKVQVVSGVNLPMVVRLACLNASSTAMPLGEMAAWIEAKGKASICSCDTAPRPGRKISDCH